jgi:hypothetical protein
MPGSDGKRSSMAITAMVAIAAATLAIVAIQKNRDQFMAFSRLERGMADARRQ